jgi:hypothetical protein
VAFTLDVQCQACVAHLHRLRPLCQSFSQPPCCSRIRSYYYPHNLYSILSAIPAIRKRHHNVFEHHHRFAGWAGLAFVWILVVTSDLQDTKNPGHFSDSGRALVVAQEFWFALIITILIFTPWATVRKVPVEITVVSLIRSLELHEHTIDFCNSLRLEWQ